MAVGLTGVVVGEGEIVSAAGWLTLTEGSLVTVPAICVLPSINSVMSLAVRDGVGKESVNNGSVLGTGSSAGAKKDVLNCCPGEEKKIIPTAATTSKVAVNSIDLFSIMALFRLIYNL